MTDEQLKERVESILDDAHPGRVYSVEDGVVWVSGMNPHCPRVAERMAQTLSHNGVPCGLVYDDDADRFGGVQFNYGPRGEI